MSLLSGIFNTTMNPAELNTKSFAGTILRLFPNGSAPLFALSSQAGKTKAKSSTHGYFSKTMTFVKTQGSAIEPDNETSIALDSTAGMTVGMVLHNTRTRENMLITTVSSPTAVVVTRAFGRVAAAATAVDDNFIQVGTAFAEGSTRPSARQLATTYVSNYTQIFRNAWGLTDTARASLAEQGYSNIAESRKDCSMFHSVDIESAILFGQPKMDTTGSQPIHATQGIIDAIYQYASANINAAGATTTYDQLVALVEEAWTYSTDAANPKSRAAFGDATAIKVLHQIARLSGMIEIMQSETAFGMQFTKFKFYKGEINFIEHPLMNALSTTATGNLLVMDLPALKLAYMDGRDTVAEEYNIQGQKVETGIDGVGGSLTSELAVELINPFSCCYVTGLTAGAA
jgi:hypothetical protein